MLLLSETVVFNNELVIEDSLLVDVLLVLSLDVPVVAAGVLVTWRAGNFRLCSVPSPA